MLKNVPKLDLRRLTPRACEYAFPKLSTELRARNAKLEAIGTERFPFEPEHIKGAARQITGLSNFGGTPFEGALSILCQSYDQDIDWSGHGRVVAYTQLVQILAIRLRLEALWRRRPEILDEPIMRPIFIIGLPRSGTTFLHHLLGQDRRFRTIPLWEEIFPLPDHDAATRPGDDKPLIARTAQINEFLRRNAPAFFQMHQHEVNEPAEELHLTALGFSSPLQVLTFCVLRYAEWCDHQDFTEAYRYLKQVLQTLSWLRGGGRFLLKGPQHTSRLKPLLTMFPDATIVQCHRDPVTCTASSASLLAYMQRLHTPNPNPYVSGDVSSYYIERLIAGVLRDRQPVDGRFIDVHFRELMTDPLAIARTLYAFVGYALPPELEGHLAAFANANRKNTHNNHGYAAADFGIDVQGKRSAYRPYYERFNVPEEAV